MNNFDKFNQNNIVLTLHRLCTKIYKEHIHANSLIGVYNAGKIRFSSIQFKPCLATGSNLRTYSVVKFT